MKYFLLYLVVEILQLIPEISSFLEVLYKKGDLKNVLRFTDKHKRQSSGGGLSKCVLRNFAKFKEKVFPGVSFLTNLQAGNLKLSEVATGDVL